MPQLRVNLFRNLLVVLPNDLNPHRQLKVVRNKQVLVVIDPMDLSIDRLIVILDHRMMNTKISRIRTRLINIDRKANKRTFVLLNTTPRDEQSVELKKMTTIILVREISGRKISRIIPMIYTQFVKRKPWNRSKIVDIKNAKRTSCTQIPFVSFFFL